MGDQTIDVEVRKPSRDERKKIEGSPCAWCGNLLHFKDIMSVQATGMAEDYVHPRCLDTALQTVDELTQTPGDQPEGESAEPTTGVAKEIVADEEI